MKNLFNKIKNNSLVITILIALFVFSLFVLPIISVASFNLIYSSKYDCEITESTDRIDCLLESMLDVNVKVDYKPLTRTVNVYVASPLLGNEGFDEFNNFIKRDMKAHDAIKLMEDTMSSYGNYIIETIIKEEELNYININIIYYYDKFNNEIFVIKNGDIEYSILELE